MNRPLATLAAASIALLAPIAAQALTAHIEGRVGVSHSVELPSGEVVGQSRDLDFNEPMSPNALSSFAIATETSDNVLASTGGRVGNGWMQFQSMATSALFAAPLDTEVSGGGSFTVYATVADTITIDALGMTGSAGSANLGYWVDGVLSAALDGASHPRSDGEVSGLVLLKVEIVANGTTTASLTGQVGNPEWMGLPPSLGFFDEPLGGLVHFTYGTPIDLFFEFYSEGSARAESDGDDDVTGLPVAATLVSDFGSTIGWAGVQDLRDEEGNPVTDFSAVSSTGTDFRFRIDPVLNVPEPSTALLLAFGLALLGARKGRLSGSTRRPLPAVASLLPPAAPRGIWPERRATPAPRPPPAAPEDSPFKRTSCGAGAG